MVGADQPLTAYRVIMTVEDTPDRNRGRARSRGRVRSWLAVGGGVLVVAFLVFQLFGLDLTDWFGTEEAQEPERQDTSLADCRGNADPGERIECRMVFIYDALDEYWLEHYPQEGYTSPGMDLYSGGVSTSCGQAVSGTGLFYCPEEEGIYLETEFFEALHAEFGAAQGPLAEMFLVAHLWGHHLQSLSGILGHLDGTTPVANSDVSRVELQADCLAGAWAADANARTDSRGDAFLGQFTESELSDAIGAVQRVAEEHLTDEVEQALPERGAQASAGQRQDWFSTGYESGAEECDTFAVSDSEL